MPDEPVAQVGPLGAWDQRAHLCLHLVRIGLGGEPKPAGEPAEVRVDGDSRHSERIPQNDVRRLAADTDLAAGDFIRWSRQVLDLLGQLADALADDDPLRRRARAAMDLVDRGIVAYSSVM